MTIHRRWVATLLAAVLAHGAWAAARMPCAAAAPTPDPHAAHHAAAATTPPDAPDTPTPADDAAPGPCVGMMACALVPALPAAPAPMPSAAPVLAALDASVVAWRDGPPLTLEPPPPKRA